jgi:hypothetical protein
MHGIWTKHTFEVLEIKQIKAKNIEVSDRSIYPLNQENRYSFYNVASCKHR